MKLFFLAFAFILAGCATPKPKPVVADLNPRRAAKAAPDGKRKVLSVWALGTNAVQRPMFLTWDSDPRPVIVESSTNGVNWIEEGIGTDVWAFTNAGITRVFRVKWAQ